MPKQRHEARFDEPITGVFNVLVRVLAYRRWGLGAPESPEPLPKVGCRYARQSESVLRRGRVLEVIRPVSLTLHETLHDPPCRVRLRLRWHVYPLETGSLLRLNLRYELNGAATLRARHWKTRLEAHCARMLYWVAHYLELERADRRAEPAPACVRSRSCELPDARGTARREPVPARVRALSLENASTLVRRSASIVKHGK